MKFAVATKRVVLLYPEIATMFALVIWCVWSLESLAIHECIMHSKSFIAYFIASTQNAVGKLLHYYMYITVWSYSLFFEI